MTFERDTASPLLARVILPGERWEPYGDRARIHGRNGRARIAHRHLCLNCHTTLGWGDDCENDTNHDYALCDQCVRREDL